MIWSQVQRPVLIAVVRHPLLDMYRNRSPWQMTQATEVRSPSTNQCLPELLIVEMDFAVCYQVAALRIAPPGGEQVGVQ